MSGGGTIQDFMSMGYLPAQHHDSSYDEACRLVMFFARRIRSEDPFEAPELDPESTGDWLGLNLWPREGTERLISGWSGSWACVVSSASSEAATAPGKTVTADERGDTKFYLHPNSGQKVPDFRFQAKEPSHWPTWHSNMPIEWPGTLNTGSDEYVQEEIFAPAFVGLVASNRGSKDYSTNVVDLTGERVDGDFYAPLHSMMSVESVESARGDMGLIAGRYLALQMGATGQGDLNSGGLASFGSELACLASSSGGPLVASPGHRVGASDTDPIVAAGIQTEAIFVQQSSGLAGPFEFHGILPPLDTSGAGGMSVWVVNPGDVGPNAGSVQYVPPGSSVPPGTVLALGTPESTMVQAKVLFNPDAGYQFGGESRNGAWQVWVDIPFLDDSIPIPGDQGYGSTTTRPRPPAPKDAGPDGKPFKRPNAATLRQQQQRLGTLPFGGITGPATGGRSQLGGSGIPGASNGSGPRRNPFGGFGIPGGAGGATGGDPKHTVHGKRKPSKATERRRALKKKLQESRDQRVKELMDRLDDDHPAKKNWRRKKAREKERREQREAKKKEKQRKKKQKEDNKKRDKERKQKERERKRKERKKKREQNKKGYIKAKLGSDPKVKKYIHGGSLGGGGGGEEWDVIVGGGGGTRREFSVPNAVNFLGGVGVRAENWAKGENIIAGAGGMSQHDLYNLRRSPKVAKLVGIASGSGQSEGWAYLDSGSQIGDGAIAILPSGTDVGKMMRGETQDADSSGTTQLVMPASYSEIAFGDLSKSSGKMVSGATIGADGAGGMSVSLYGADGSLIPSVGIGFGEGGTTITGKLNVTGMIDPVGIAFDEQASRPSSWPQPSVGVYLPGLYAGDTAGANEAWWVRDDGTSVDLSAGGVSTLHAYPWLIRRDFANHTEGGALFFDRESLLHYPGWTVTEDTLGTGGNTTSTMSGGEELDGTSGRRTTYMKVSNLDIENLFIQEWHLRIAIPDGFSGWGSSGIILRHKISVNAAGTGNVLDSGKLLITVYDPTTASDTAVATSTRTVAANVAGDTDYQDLQITGATLDAITNPHQAGDMLHLRIRLDGTFSDLDYPTFHIGRLSAYFQ